MAVYQEKAHERLKKGLRKMQTLVQRGIQEDYKEADTRTIVLDILTDYFGWDKYDNITAEQMIGSRYADFVIKDKNEELFVVEVKQMGLKLKETHLNQARQYAVDEGIDWAILTNGDDWQIYRTSLEGKIPVTKPVFSFKISDESSSPKAKTDLMYYLTEEASRKKEIEDYYWYRVALSGENLAKHILSDPVINKLRIELNKSTKQHLKNYEIAEALQKRLFTTAIDSEECERRTERLRRLKS